MRLLERGVVDGGSRIGAARLTRCHHKRTAALALASTTDGDAAAAHKPRVVVVGGGWGGLGAAMAAAKAGAQVTLLGAGSAPGGLAGAAGDGGAAAEAAALPPMELGVKGFWRCYANIDALLAELASDLPRGGALTPYTRSGFYDERGLVVSAPVFGDLPRLPAPLGTLVHTAGLFRRDLPLSDRLSAAGLVPHLLAHDADAAAYARYDEMSAAELFRAAGVSPALLKAFLEPMLLVTLFAPAEKLSAAAALGALYYFAVAHQADFDVRWARGPVSSLILTPLARRLERMGVEIAYGRRATQVLPAEGAGGPRAGGVVAEVGGGGKSSGSGSSSSSSSTGAAATETYPADAVVLAAGAAATARIAAASPLLAGARDLTNAGSLGACDALAARLWLDRRVALPFASNVVTGFDAGVGATMFDLTTLQDLEFGSGKSGSGSVIELDVYNAAPLMGLDDAAVTDLVLSRYLPAALGIGAGGAAASASASAAAARAPPAAVARAVDARIVRAPRATTLFSPGSAAALLPAVASVRGVFCAGDAVEQGPGTHGAKGLSQEKGYVTGLQAGNAAARMLGLTPRARVLPAEPDEPHVELARAVARGASLATEAARAAARL